MPLSILHGKVTVQLDGSLVYAANNHKDVTYNRNQVTQVDVGVYGVCMKMLDQSWYLIIRTIEGYLSVVVLYLVLSVTLL